MAEFTGTAEAFPNADPGTATTGDTVAESAASTINRDSVVDDGLITNPETTRAFNQRLEAIREREKALETLQQRAEMVDRFYREPAYARQVIEQMAPNLGITISSQAPNAESNSGNAPPQFLDAIRRHLGSDYGFLAEPFAQAMWEAGQHMIQPIAQQQERATQQHEQATRERSQSMYQGMAEELSRAHPGWEAHENDMYDRLNFLRAALNGGSLTHPKYGSILSMLYQLSTGNGHSVAEAGRRMSQAAQNATRTGTPDRQAPPNTQELIRGADNANSRWEIAFQDALSQHNIS